jgi:two-component system, OmpR family, sensor kinase
MSARVTSRKLSLRARLLTGLIAVTAVFLIVMGAVSAVFLGGQEQSQFNADLQVIASSGVVKIANAQGGYAAAYLSRRTGAVGVITPPSAAASELQSLLTSLVASGRAKQYLEARPADQVFAIALSGDPPLRAVWHPANTGLQPNGALSNGGLLPVGRSVVFVARPVSAADDHVRGLVLAELITGGVLLALLLLGGNWLIGRGLAPLDRMASTADLITSRGDLGARMPDPGDRREAGRLAGAINTMLDRIQQAFGARLQSEQKVRQFAADASHELRTPLTTIRGYAELYRQGALGPGELPNAMRRIEQEADRMSRLVAELLELARLDRTSSLSLTEVDLAVLVRDAVADAHAVEPGRPVRADAPPALVVTVDEPRIRQVLANLLGNVRAHTPAGTPTAVRLSTFGQGALLEVADAGPGMDPADAARAFDRFHRGVRNADGAGSRNDHAPDTHSGDNGDGSGLGLSIVQAIAAAHGGQARLMSAPGAGTTVQVWIPFVIPNEAGFRPGASAS